MLRHVASTSNEITLVDDHMKSDLLPTGILPELRQSNKTDIQLSLTDYEGLLHLMLRLHVASTSNERFFHLMLCLHATQH